MELIPKQKSDVQFNGEKLNLNWIEPYAKDVSNEFQERYEKIIKLYEELSEEVYWNNLIYSLDIKFKPVIGNIYYLYKENEKYFLSIITPWEWKREFIGEFKFEYSGKWIKIN